MKITYLNKIFLLLVVLIFLVFPPVSALNVEIQPATEPLRQILNEGQTLDFSMLITGIPTQTAFIELETDLEPFNSTLVWNISDSSRFGVEKNSSLLMQKNIRLTPPAEITAPIVVKVSGKVPLVKQVTTYKGVVFTKVERKTGYLYYRVQPYDSKGYPVGVGDTKTFSINPGGKTGDDPQSEIDKIQDPEMKIITQDLYDKGLWQEASRLIGYANHQTEIKNNEPAKVTVLIYLVSIVIVGFALFVLGYRTKKCPRQDDEEDNEREV